MRTGHIEELPATDPKPVAAGSAPDRIVSTKDLLGEAHRVWIEHASGRYLLQVTRSGKLILTK